MPMPLLGGPIKRCFCLMSVCMSVAYSKHKWRTERPRKTKIGREIAHVTCDSDTTVKVKGKCHKAALLTAALTRKAAAAVTVWTYSACESTATLRLLGGALGTQVEERGRGILCLQVHSLFCLWSFSLSRINNDMCSVIFVNENENENYQKRTNNECVNEKQN